MTWFKVDDKLHSHNKTRKVLAEAPSALALWVVAGSWSSDNLSDGFVPDHQLPWLIPNGAEEMARVLVAARFWRRVKGGYQFHEWAVDADGTKRNPTREDVESERRKKADAGRKGGLARANNHSISASEMGKVGGQNAKINKEDAHDVQHLEVSNPDQGTAGENQVTSDLTCENAVSTTQAPAIAGA